MVDPGFPDDWPELMALVDALLDEAPERRHALIAELSAGDTVRRVALERLLAECERDSPLLSRPAAQRFAALFAEDAPCFPDALADRYRPEREVGRGGMAVVYLAHDLKHARDVAVKIVRPELAAVLGRSRFLREIHIAAQLSHPNIVPLYDSGEVPSGTPARAGADASVLYYVMPYESGRSLRERLDAEGPLGIDDAMLIVRDVAEALAYAHHHGIVHRDIKPDNILLAGRRAMVTDFGIARALTQATMDPATGAHELSFGTAAYMAPEQVANDPRLDHRGDIYALGAMAYELLTGRTPAIGDGPPVPVASLRPDMPPALAGLLMACLARDPAYRVQDADDLLARLDRIASPASGPAPPARAQAPASPRSRSRVVAWAVAAGAVVVAFLLATRTRADERRPLVLGRAAQLTFDPGLEVQPSLSPDGRQVAYAAGHSLHMRIFIRPVAGGRATPLNSRRLGNEWMPRWSPDGSRVLFLARGGVFSAPALGGAAREEVAGRPGVTVTAATWSGDGREIAYVRGDSLLARAPASGTTRLVALGSDLHSCTWSRSGSRLACVSGNSFYVTVGAIAGVGPMFGNLAPSRIVVVPASGGAPASVTDSGSLHQSPTWSGDGRTLYYVSNREGVRDVYALDLSRWPAREQPVRVTTGMNAQSVDLSSDGRHVVYAAYTSSANVWSLPIPSHPPVTAAAAVAVTSGNQTVEGVRVSRDRRWLVYDSNAGGNSDVYRMPIAGGEPERLTSGPFDEFRGDLSPDGGELVYHSFQTGTRNIFLRRLRTGSVQQLTRSARHMAMATWSPDGSAIAFFGMVTGDVRVMRRDASGRWSPPRVLTPGWRPEWSPDGRTVAFISRVDGRIGVVPADSGATRDVYVPGVGDPIAELALFSSDGRELYFKSHDAHGRAAFWSVAVAGGRPRLLVTFDDPARSSNRFDFASDGLRLYFTIEDRQSDIWVADVAHRAG